MTDELPPRWLEQVLRRFLADRDRETISGDLLEEYREDQVPRCGRVRANVWYLRQTLSLISLRELLELPMQHLLRCMAVFTGAAGVWLAVMENILKHAGYPERTVIAVAIVVQGVATLLVPVIYVRSIFRVFVSTGAIALAFFGAYSVQRILAAQSFEGFVLLIGFALILQGVLTLVVVLRPRHENVL